MSRTIKRITANEARAYLSDDWCEKLNEIYDGVRAILENEGDYYEFQLDESKPYTNEIIMKALELDGYRIYQIVKHSSTIYRIHW